MKIKIFNILAVLAAAVLFTGCSDKDESTSGVYLPQGIKSIATVFSITDDPYEVKFVAALAGSEFATAGVTANNDITVNFAVDMSLVGKYNRECGTDYLQMPEGSYSFPASAVIERGKGASDSVTVSIMAKDVFESFELYMLPIRITSVNGAQAYPYQQVLYIGLSGVADAANIPLYDRTGWEIVDFSTQEPGEGGGNGLAQCVLDNNVNTFWHSQWAGGTPGPPHHFTVDMKEPVIVHGIALMNRYFEGSWATEGHGQPKNVKIEISDDGVVWTDNGSFANLAHPSGQPFLKYFFTIYKPARYIRLTVTEAYVEQYTCLAEFGVF